MRWPKAGKLAMALVALVACLPVSGCELLFPTVVAKSSPRDAGARLDGGLNLDGSAEDDSGSRADSGLDAAMHADAGPCDGFQCRSAACIAASWLVRVTLESSLAICTNTQAAIQPCKGDAECKKAGDVCCAAYDEPVCLPAERCPKTCETSTDCNTKAGQLCCETLAKVDTSLKAGGVCIAPGQVPCPKACAQSSDCNTKGGELCCDGLCSTSCEHDCTESNECTGQICCKTRAAFSSLVKGSKPPGYTGVGIPLIPDAGTGSGPCDGVMCFDGSCVETGRTHVMRCRRS